MTPLAARASAALHSKATAEWFTPRGIVAAAREVLGSIDCDPASCAEANEVIRAMTFFDERSNGLSDANPWIGTVFLNPPGGKMPGGGASLVSAFWSKLQAELDAGRTTAAIWIGYSIEQLQTLQRSRRSPLEYPICIPRRRIAFDAPADATEKRSPTHGNFIALVQPELEPSLEAELAARMRLRFRAAFSHYGAVKL